MGRLCERPGCSENAALAYGMRTEDLVFWVDVLRDTPDADNGVLCQRHGDSMTVPRGWTLDDLREPDLHLFRPPPRPDGPVTHRNRGRRGARGGDDTGQLALGGLIDDAVEDEVVDDGSGSVAPEVDAVLSDTEGPTPSGALDWKPAFHDGDDLDGLLAASSPLLSRAFRGDRG